MQAVLSHASRHSILLAAPTGTTGTYVPVVLYACYCTRRYSSMLQHSSTWCRCVCCRRQHTHLHHVLTANMYCHISYTAGLYSIAVQDCCVADVDVHAAVMLACWLSTIYDGTQPTDQHDSCMHVTSQSPVVLDAIKHNHSYKQVPSVSTIHSVPACSCHTWFSICTWLRWCLWM